MNYLQAQHIVQKLNHIFQQGKKQTLDMLLKGPMKDIWNNSTSRELGQLANGWKNEQEMKLYNLFQKRKYQLESL